MIISLPNEVDTPADFFIYASDENDNLCGYTDDSTYNSYSVGEIPTNFSIFYLPTDTDNSYYTYAEIQELLTAEFPFLLDSKIKLLKKIRDIKTFEPISYMGYTFKADKVSQQDITDATLQAAMEGQSFSKMWVADEGVVTLTYDTMIGLKTAIGHRRESLVYECATIVQQMSSMRYETLAIFEIDY